MEPRDPERTRHVAFRVEADSPVHRDDLAEAVRAVGTEQLGEEGLAAMNPWLTIFDGAEGLLRVRHTHQEEARAVLEAITWLGDPDNEASVTTLGASGTMRAAREKHLSG